eukprot:jgi/Chlat1/3035/Chrsp206S03287
MEAMLLRLRLLVRSCLGHHLHSSAIFFADKLTTLSHSDPGDVYLLAQAYFVSSQYRRALHLLQQHDLVAAHPLFRYLSAKCLEACREWDEAVTLLEADNDSSNGVGAMDADLSIQSPTFAIGTASSGINLEAVTFLLKGRIHDSQENRPRALQCYKAALSKDPYCYEAFEHIINNHMISSKDEHQLLNSLAIKPEDQWLLLLYKCKTKKYNQPSFEAEISTLESGVDCCGVRVSLKENPCVAAYQADYLYHNGQYQLSYELTTRLLEKDPYDLMCLPVHLASAVELKQKNDLAIAWFAVGCYYYCTQQFEAARRHFSKATSLEAMFLPAWIGFGHAFAAQEESDQAMAAYRTAARLFPGCHLPLLCIGMEYMRTLNANLAEQYLVQAHTVCQTDPLLYNELGVLAFRNQQFAEAEGYFRRALSLAPLPLGDAWEATIVNLAHALRKRKVYGEAVLWYEKALCLSPQRGSTLAALGYTCHLQGRLADAIEYYHSALSLVRDDTFTAEMLNSALYDECMRFSANDIETLPA